MVRLVDDLLDVSRIMRGKIEFRKQVVDLASVVARGGRDGAAEDLGLTVVRRLVELHGGSVTAHSEGLGKGSECVVRLPGILEGCRQQPTEASPGPAQASVARHILVVDDNVDAAESVAMILRLSGHEVRLAHNGPEALKMAEQYQPEVVVLDIGLPGMNGYEVAKRLRQTPQFRETLLIAVTGYGQEEDRRKSLDAGFNQYLVKPVDPAALQTLLASIAS